MTTGILKIAMELKGALPSVKNQMPNILMMVATEAQHEWQRQARQALHGTAHIYIGSMSDPVLRRNQVTITLRADTPGGKLANRLEQGCGPWDMKCIADGKQKIYSSKGYVSVKDIKIGDLVLTGSGKMRRVLETYRSKLGRGEFVYRIRTNYKNGYISVTGNHPVLTNSGWVRADKLDPSVHKIVVLAVTCNNCGKLIEYKHYKHKNYDPEANQYCNKSCASHVSNKFRRENGRTDFTEEIRKSISLKASERNSRLLREGTHPWTRKRDKLIALGKWGYAGLSEEKLKEYQHKAAVAIGKKHNFTDPESKFWKGLEEEGLTSFFQRQVMIKRECEKLQCGKYPIKRWFFIDFGNEDLKLAIEINGERYHTKEGVSKRTSELEKNGWRVINFWSQEIYKNLDRCLQEVKQVLFNHTNKFIFTTATFEVEKVKVKKFSGYGRYNLTVDEDESFIVSTIVVHNSGFLNSPKAKGTGKDKYITIPLSLKSAGSMGGSPPVMPSTIYKKAAQLEIGQSMTLPKKYEGLGLRTRLSADLKRWDHYTWKTSPFQGITKVARWPNLIPLGLPRESAGSYMVFRRVSRKSDPNSWIHPGFRSLDLLSKTQNYIEQIFPKILDNVLIAK